MSKIIYNPCTEESFSPDKKSFSNFIGQKSVVNQIKFFCDSHCEETPFPTLLFSGSHGLGKTFIAEKIAKYLGRDYILINCSDVNGIDDFVKRFYLNIKRPTTLFFDESHVLSKQISTFLLTMINPVKNNINYISYGEVSLAHDLSKVNFIFATTDAYQMLLPLRNRANLVMFETYNHEEIQEMLKLYIGNISLQCDMNDLSDACRSRARDTYILAQNIKRYCKNYNITIFTQKDWENLKGVFKIFPKGLNSQEIKLLNLVCNFGPISCNNIAVKMGLNEHNVKEDIEIRLQELGMIENTTKGRSLTNLGVKYLNEL